MQREDVGTRPDDEVRTRTILDYEVLGRPPEPDLQSLVELAAHVCAVPTAVINLVTDTEQHSIAAVGVPRGVVDLSGSLCSVSLVGVGPVVAQDASRDQRFAHSPFVNGQQGNIKFYAASQLRTPGGVTVGTLCVFDETARAITPVQAGALDALAAQVVDVLELRRRSTLLRRALGDRDQALVAAENAQSELQRSNTALSAFAGQVSHDLRNPLAAVTSCLETLGQIDSVRADPEALQFLALGQRAASGMQELVGRLLAYARVDGALTYQSVDLAAVAAGVVEGLDLLVRRASAVVEMGELPVVQGDAVQLRTVVENLVTNALKFRAPGRPPVVRVSAHRVPGGWCVQVADNGIGIVSSARSDVFGAFRRLPGSSDVDGFGLGLATCRRIVCAHGGDIGVDETPGGGATLWFLLPDTVPAHVNGASSRGS